MNHASKLCQSNYTDFKCDYNGLGNKVAPASTAVDGLHKKRRPKAGYHLPGPRNRNCRRYDQMGLRSPYTESANTSGPVWQVTVGQPLPLITS
ncbi:hypothetical protein DSCW_57210 [Desulfosarcina widdelii]|uniref:Uncharacterized protein n=1 Tax=Desulfosarcina widdelii TaxID=947919 RepID=A0A5K7ZJ56_9BACT|nr:hypothetical protein DSCW_57210 [Desulfosarcina widdelii]